MFLVSLSYSTFNMAPYMSKNIFCEWSPRLSRCPRDFETVAILASRCAGQAVQPCTGANRRSTSPDRSKPGICWRNCLQKLVQSSSRYFICVFSHEPKQFLFFLMLYTVHSPLLLFVRAAFCMFTCSILPRVFHHNTSNMPPSLPFWKHFSIVTSTFSSEHPLPLMSLQSTGTPSCCTRDTRKSCLSFVFFSHCIHRRAIISYKEKTMLVILHYHVSDNIIIRDPKHLHLNWYSYSTDHIG